MEPVAGLRGVGSFDCIAGRFADGNFAQHDSARMERFLRDDELRDARFSA